MTKVLTPRKSGQYGVRHPELGQRFYDVVDGVAEVPAEELARFLYAVEGSRVAAAEAGDQERITRLPSRTHPEAPVADAGPAPEPKVKPRAARRKASRG